MRFRFGSTHVDEVVQLDATPVWEKENNSDVPNYYVITIGMAIPDGFNFDYSGEYKLDGTKETYNAAVENFEKIVKHATEYGWFSEDMFENFEFY